MEIVLILAAGLGTTYLVARHTGRRHFDLADGLIGIFAGLASLGLAELLRGDGAELQLGLPLFFACALAFGLEALPHRASWH